MSRQSKRAADLGFAAITVEGGLISPEQLSGIASATPDQKLAAEYSCPKGTNLRDEITRYFRIAQAHWQGYARLAAPTGLQTETFVKSLLEQAFGFQLSGPHTHLQSDRRFQIAWETKQGRVPVVVAAPITVEKGKLGEGFTRAQAEFGDGPGGRIPKRSPAVLLQDWLNANEASQWGLVFAGDRLRLMRDNASLTRPAYIEADLGAILRDEMFSDFTLLWLLIHASRFGAEGTPTSESALERWREAGMKAGTAARERLRGNVEAALLSLGQGLLDANPQLRQGLDDKSLPMPQLFEQLLRVVYRLIFLAVAEDRELLHVRGTTRATAQLYGENYSFACLRDRSLRRNAHDHHLDAWDGLKIVFNALANGAQLLGLPALGGLFGAGLTPDLDGAQLPNRALMAAIYKLGWLDNAGPRVRINWRDMATEELGSVYEGLLELVAAREEGGRKFSFAGGAEARGNARKTSGSYYTPDSLVQCLLDSALNPVLERAEAEGGVAAILDLNVIDPACGSGHFLLGAARRMATRVAQLRDPDAPDYSAAMRDVVRNCIHGVDRNPMAIELAKVALWIETVEPGKPLGFLDANLQCGDSLLGIFDLKALDEGIPDDAYKPLTGDDKETAKHFAKRNKAEKVGQGMLDLGAGGSIMPPMRLAAQMDELRQLPEDTVAHVEAKRQKFSAWVNNPARYATKVACDLYIAAFLMPKVGGPPASAGAAMIPTTAHVRMRLSGGQIHSQLEGAAVDAAMSALAFHWPLAFPEVMVTKGGFDAVLGNPPWEVAQLSEKEYFSALLPEVASLTGNARKEAIEKLQETNPTIYSEFKTKKRMSDASNEYVRNCKVFAGASNGKLNTYALFLSLSYHLMRLHGAVGLVVPAEFLTSENNSEFLGLIINTNVFHSCTSFENEEFVFPGIANVVRFSLLTLLGGSNFARMMNYLKSTTEIFEPERLVELRKADFELFSPSLGTSPIFRSKDDYRLSRKLFSFGKSRSGRTDTLTDVWGCRSKQGIFNMSSDSGLFKKQTALKAMGLSQEGTMTFSGLDKMFLPLYEGKFVSHFDHRFSSYHNLGKEKGRGGRGLPPVQLDEYGNTSFEVLPRYWVDSKVTMQKFGGFDWQYKWLLGWRDISSSKLERTVTMAAIPFTATGDTLSILFTRQPPRLTACLMANFNRPSNGLLCAPDCRRQSRDDRLSSAIATSSPPELFIVRHPLYLFESDRTHLHQH